MKRSHLLLLIVILPGAILLSGCASKRVQDNGFVQSAKELDRQALRLYWRGETKQALLAWSAAIDKEPGLARAYYNRGICKASLGRHGSAVADFDRALQRRSGFVSALVNRALSKLRLGDDAGTDPFGKEGAQPPSPEGAGPDSVSRKRIATAERQKGSSLEPGKPKASRSSPPAEANLAGSQPSGPPGKDLKGDRSDVSEAAVMRESYARALRILLREDRYLEARRKFEGFIAGFPESRLLPNAYYWLGETYYVRQEYRHSIRIFRQGAERFPEHPKAPGCLLKIGLAYKSLDQASQAAKYFRMVTRKYPKSRSARIAEEEMEGL
jgi:tol-pal system protein YbgF